MKSIDIRIHSRIPVEHRTQLEELLFFNSQQSRYAASITEAVGRFGSPRLVVDGGFVRVQSDRAKEAQSLIATVSQPTDQLVAGIVIFTRTSSETLTIIHAATHPDFSVGGVYGGTHVFLRMIKELRQIASRIRGIRSIRILYGDSRSRDVPVGPTRTTP